MKKQTNAEFVVATADILWKNVVTMADGNVPNAYWNRNNRQANLDGDDPDNRDDNCGVRSSVNVYGVLLDLIQPPSIRPISDAWLCAWKICVSFITSNSRQARSLNRIISR